MVRSLIDLGSDPEKKTVGSQSGVLPAPTVPSLPPACALSFREETRRIFVDVVQKQLIASGKRPAPRPVFRKVHGIAKGTLRINRDIPERFRHGLFAKREFAAWIRFSSDTAPEAPDSKNATIGVGIKLFGTNGETLDADDPQAGTADLLMQNHDRFFVNTGEDFCAFSHAAVFGDFAAYLAAHPETKTVLDEMAKPESSILLASYWSVLPYACGPEAIVKYRLQPRTPASNAQPGTDPNYLKLDLEKRLLAGEANFELAVQLHSTDAETPIDAAMQRWPTPFQAIGVLTLEKQDITQVGQAAYGDNLSIHPWRVPHANRPLGSIADSRRITYRSAAHLRRTVNGVPVVEPVRPR